MPLPDARLSRRTLLGGSAALLGAGLLPACSAPAAPGVAPGAAAATRTVPSAYGPVEVPSAPQRIVTVSYNTPFQLQAVGVQPVGAFDYSALYDQLTADQIAMLERAEPVGTFGEPSLEAIAALAPDLVVGEDGEVDEALAARLSALAPTVVVGGAARGDWKAISSGVADTAGAADALDAARTAYLEEVARLRAEHAVALTDEVWAAFSFGDEAGQFSLQFPTGIVGALMTELGMTLLPAVRDGAPDGGYESYSLEQLGLVEPATVAIYPVAVDGSQYPALAEVMASPLYPGLPVVAAGRTFPVVAFYGVTDFGTGLAALRELESVVLRRM